MGGSGIPYFPLDVTLDTKFALIEAEFGIKGFGVIVKLYQQIYGEQGYYIEWTDEVELLFAKRLGLSQSSVSEIVKACVRRGIFDGETFRKYSVLTSKGIQERYLKAVGRRIRVEMNDQYLLLCNAEIPKNVVISAKNVDISSQNVNISEQSKVKESKVKEKKVNKKQADGSKKSYRANNQINNPTDNQINIIAHAEYCFGRPLTPLEIEYLQGFTANYSEKWIRDALNIAGEANARNMRYVAKVLENKENGYTKNDFSRQKEEQRQKEIAEWLKANGEEVPDDAEN